MLLTAFPPSVEHLDLLLAMLNRIDEAHQEIIHNTPWPNPADRPDSLASPTTMMLTYNIDRILAGLADSTQGNISYTEEQVAALESYRQLREERRALTLSVVENMGITRSASEDELEDALEELKDPSRLDRASWQLVENVARRMWPEELNWTYLYQLDTLNLARQVCGVP
jgi:hypothetical protein